MTDQPIQPNENKTALSSELRFGTLEQRTRLLEDLLRDRYREDSSLLNLKNLDKQK